LPISESGAPDFFFRGVPDLTVPDLTAGLDAPGNRKSSIFKVSMIPAVSRASNPRLWMKF
jgi:hypothetical protein